MYDLSLERTLRYVIITVAQFFIPPDPLVNSKTIEDTKMKNNEEGNDIETKLTGKLSSSFSYTAAKKGNVAGRIKAFEKLSPEKRMTSMEKDLLKKIEDDSFMKRGSSIYSGEFNSFPTEQIKSNHTDAPNLALVPAPRSALISHPISAPITAPFLVPVSTPVSALITTPKSILNASNNNTYASIHSQPVADLTGKSTHSSHAPPKEAFANDHSLDNIPGNASHAPTYQISKSFANQSIHDDDGDDFFGMFSTKSGDENSVKGDRPQPTSEIETSLLDIDDMSAFSGSTAMSAHRSRQEKLNKKFSNPLAIGSSGSVSSSVKSSSRISHLDNPLFCPKPARPRNMNDVNLLLAMKHSSTGKSPLPDWEMVTHSGKIKARLSYKQLVMRKWVDSFWIIYNRSRLIVFKSEDDFGEWMTNPYLNLRDRRKLAKFDVNFVKDLYRVNTKGYQVTCVKQKTYRYKMRYNLL